MEEHIKSMLPLLDEKQKRLFLASMAKTYGHGGVKKVCEISGCSPHTIIKGKKELEEGIPENDGRVRKSGGGRKQLADEYPDLLCWIERIVSNETYGNPENPLVWTTKSLRNIQDAILSKHGVYISFKSIGTQLKKLGYSLQLNQKMLQVGSEHPDRNTQFEFINGKSKKFIEQGQPVISVDTKKKELVGNFKNNGAEYSKKKNPTKVLDHDFPLKELGKVAPYGIYDIAKNEGFVNLGLSKDTAEFAMESILRWWQTLGVNTYPDATKLYINCDGGGSNGSRVKLWKKQLQELANITGLEMHVSHFPPGTSKWNKIEHKMFCFISKNWRGKPLISVETIISLISSTTTKEGLKIVCVKDENVYQLGKKVTDEELSEINIKKEKVCGEWNYTILPTK